MLLVDPAQERALLGRLEDDVRYRNRRQRTAFHELAQEVLAKAKETPEGEGNQPDEQVPEAEGQQEKAESEPTKEAKRESPIENESPDHLSENEASGELSSPGNLAGVATKKGIDP